MTTEVAKPAYAPEKDVEQSFSEASAAPAFGPPQPLTPEQRALEAKLARKVSLTCLVDWRRTQLRRGGEQES